MNQGRGEQRSRETGAMTSKAASVRSAAGQGDELPIMLSLLYF